MKIAVPKSTIENEARVSIIPETCARLSKAGLEPIVQTSAGEAASFPDSEYASAGAQIIPDAASLFDEAEVVVMVQPPTPDELHQIKSGTMLFSVLSPLTNHDVVRQLAERGIHGLALDMMPRITRAQKMDVLSSMSTVAGYKAVLLAASELTKMFPMLMTAAGTITPAKVLVLGAGVAGLQAIATARRLGAVVEAFDVRPAVKEQVESLGARFVEVEAPQEDAEDAGGYAKEMSEAYKIKQGETIAAHAAESDVVVSTALIPGKPAPILITADTVRKMKPGSAIVDLAAEGGGNCELTRLGETVVENGVSIMGPKNLPASVPYHASQMFSRNVGAFLQELIKEGRVVLDMENECVTGTLITQSGEIVHQRVRESMGLEPLATVQGSAV
ncbi:MAG: Re/Si-specific NAD(P)(+) transhydrogenase subunit alpha [Phycisphaerales bacterium]|nr:Re/Si-specific NAD(P)(+) transhydrogenase subunit alpha [Phycisphaerales bacterium]